MPATSFPTLLPRVLAPVATALLLVVPARASEVFAKPPSPAGGVNKSSWVSPDGNDNDSYAWDDFTLERTQTITEVRWRGGYANGGAQGKATTFRISFFDSIAGGSQPVITALPEHEDQEVVIATFNTDDNAGETYVGTFGGVAMYDYRFVLPTPVTIPGGVKCWFRVVAAQPVFPDWGMATSSSGSHFKYITGLHMFQFWPNELAFSLHARWADLGGGTVGVNGAPSLGLSGPLTPGSSLTLELLDGAPSALALVFISVSSTPASFLGGTLHAFPFDELVIVGTDPTGALAGGVVFPGAPPGTEFWFQVGLADASVPLYGASLSNGVVGTVP